MIKASEIAEALSAMDAAIRYITDSDFAAPGRVDVRSKLIKSRVDLEFALMGITLKVEVDQ